MDEYRGDAGHGKGAVTIHDEVGSQVGGHPTIYLKIASYRDELCHITLSGTSTVTFC